MLCSSIARDKGIDVNDLHSVDEVSDMVFKSVRDGSCIAKKGHRTTFRRFFSWYLAHNWHDQHWHSKLLLIIYIGMRLGVYKSTDSLPTIVRKLGASMAKADGAEEAGDEDEDEQGRPDLREAAAAVAAEEAARANESADDEVKEPVSKGGTDELKRLRAKCKNSLYVAGAILGKADLQDKCRMVWMVGKPFYDAHSEHARFARGPQGLRRYDFTAACNGVMKQCHACAQISRDLDCLQMMGLDTSSSVQQRKPGQKRLDVDDLRPKDDDDHAGQLMRLILNHIRFRVNSMSWHSDAFPGLLALWLSQSLQVKADAWDLLV